MVMKTRPRNEAKLLLEDAWDDLRDAALDQRQPSPALVQALNAVLRLQNHGLAVPLRSEV